jgi:hypothetical protein
LSNPVRSITDLNQLESELQSLVSEEKQHWQEVAKLLITAKRDEFYKEHAKNYTQWLRLISKKVDIHEAWFWRILKAGEYYLSITETDDVDLISNSVLNPDKLDLLEKIGRYAPEEKREELLDRALSGNISRRELRETWNNYKPIGANRSGRKAENEKFKPAEINPATQSVINKAIILDALKNPEWMMPGVIDHKFFSNVSFGYGDLAVMITRNDHVSAPVLCGVKVLGKKDLDNLAQYKNFLDFLYVAVLDQSKLIQLAKDNLPEDIGILTIVKSSEKEKTGRLYNTLCILKQPVKRNLMQDFYYHH